MPFTNKYPPAVYEYINSHKDDGVGKIQKGIKEKFGTDISTGTVQYRTHPEYAERYKLKKRGKRKPSFLLKPVGTERIDKDGYVRVMVQEGVERLKHYIVWEEATGKKAGKDECIIFLNGDRTDCRIENLYCLKRKYMAALNNSKFRNLPPDMIKLGINAVILAVETKAKERRLRNKGNRSVIHKGNTMFVNYINGYLEGKTAGQIAEEYGKCKATVCQTLLRYKDGGYDKWLDELGLGNLKPTRQ